MTALPHTRPAAHPNVLLAADRRSGGWEPAGPAADAVPAGRLFRGRIAARLPSGTVRRAEPGPLGPLVLEARAEGGQLACEVWGPRNTPATVIEAALAATAAWVGARDDPTPLGRLAGAHPLVARALRELGAPRLGRLPRVGEAAGRAVLAQLVQHAEARRSVAQVAARFGQPAHAGLWAWPDAATLARTPAWDLRPCGVSQRMATAVQAAAVEDGRLTAAAQREDWTALGARVRALPGAGAWTAAKVQTWLGDPDAVPVGDYNLPQRIGTALTGEQRPRQAWSDAELLELLAPFAGQRARVIRLVGAAAAAGLAAQARRRAPRAALSAHRYW